MFKLASKSRQRNSVVLLKEVVGNYLLAQAITRTKITYLTALYVKNVL